MASINLEIESNEDIQEVMTQVENRIDSIVNFPDDLRATHSERATMDEGPLGNGRGCLLAIWMKRTRKVMGQEIAMRTATITRDKEAYFMGR